MSQFSCTKLEILEKRPHLEHFQEVLRKSLMYTQQIFHCSTKTALSKRKFKISFRGPSIWNSFLKSLEKEIESLLLFKYFSREFATSVDENRFYDKDIVAFCKSLLVSKTNYLWLENIIVQCVWMFLLYKKVTWAKYLILYDIRYDIWYSIWYEMTITTECFIFELVNI